MFSITFIESMFGIAFIDSMFSIAFTDSTFSILLISGHNPVKPCFSRLACTFTLLWCPGLCIFIFQLTVWGVEPVVTHQISWLESTGVCGVQQNQLCHHNSQ